MSNYLNKLYSSRLYRGFVLGLALLGIAPCSNSHTEQKCPSHEREIANGSIEGLVQGYMLTRGRILLIDSCNTPIDSPADGLQLGDLEKGLHVRVVNPEKGDYTEKVWWSARDVVTLKSGTAELLR